MYKCGGTTVKRLLHEFKEEEIQYSIVHGSVRALPEEFKNFYRYALVRNPLTWYESYYAWTVGRMTGFNSFNGTYGRGTTTFEPIPLGDVVMDKVDSDGEQVIVNLSEFIERTTDLTKFFTEHPDRLAILKSKARIEFGKDWLKALIGDVTKLTAESFNNESLYAFFMRKLGIIDIKVYRMEDEFKEALSEVGLGHVEITHENKSEYLEHSTKKDRERIVKADSKFFTAFGYSEDIT